jgi:kynureninase
VSTLARAQELDAQDPLAGFREQFLEPEDGIVGYLDGNSLGRPPKATAERLQELVTQAWGTRLIRSWDEQWMRWPEETGDMIASAALGAAPGQTVVGDSTTVMLYKLARAAVDAQAGRTEIVLDTDNFPTDRYVLEGIAAERGLTLRWIDTDPESGIHPEQVAEAVGPNTALVAFSHVAYRSGFLADAAAITQIAHDAGALVLWDLCHSVGSVPVELDAWDVDLAVGCTYKFLNGGPGAPAFGFVSARLQDRLRQPIWGWMGRKDPFQMAHGYVPADGIRGMVSGTPPIVGMLGVRGGVEMLAEAGSGAVRRKSLQLTDFALEIVDSWPADLGVRVASPREHARRGGHITIRREDFRDVNEELWRRGVIPDFREPDGIRIGLAPLSTSFEEVFTSMQVIHDVVTERKIAETGPARETDERKVEATA